MFRKVMGISDQLMWRYWSCSLMCPPPEIAALKQREPMSEDGAGVPHRRRFHSAADARQAQEDFNAKFAGAEPADIEQRPNPATTRLGNARAKLMVTSGVAPSRTEGERLLKAGAVEIDGQRGPRPTLSATAVHHPLGEEVEEDHVIRRRCPRTRLNPCRSV